MTPRPPACQDEPLSPNPYTPHSQPNWHNAYEAALKLEENHEIHGRVLGYLLLEALDDDVRDYVARGINQFEQAPNGTTLLDLAQIYVDHLLSLQGGPPYDSFCESYSCDWSDSPTGQMQPWDQPSLTEFDLVLPSIDPHPNTLQGAKYAALHRDGQRCVVSGNHDYYLAVYGLLTYAEDSEEISKNARKGGSGLPITYPAHIFPPFARSDEGESEGRSLRRYTFQAIDIARGYGHVDVMSELKPSRGQRLSNIMSMGSFLRHCFNHQRIWFEPTSPSPSDSHNTYFMDSCFIGHGFPYRYCEPRLLTFTTTDDRLELPNPAYLRLHAVASRIAQRSGAHQLIRHRC